MISVRVEYPAVGRAVLGLDYFARRQMAAIRRGGNDGVHYMQTLARTRYIVSAGGRPNRPPGPLKSRTGRLRKGIKMVGPNVNGTTMVIGLDLWGSAERYGWVHERGGLRSYMIRPVRKKVLRWIGPDGQEVFARSVRHPPLDPRPFLGPAVRDGAPYTARRIDFHLQALANDMLVRYLR